MDGTTGVSGVRIQPGGPCVSSAHSGTLAFPSYPPPLLLLLLPLASAGCVGGNERAGDSARHFATTHGRTDGRRHGRTAGLTLAPPLRYRGIVSKRVDYE